MRRPDAQAQTLITTVAIEDEVILPDAKKLGVNLGAHDQYGSSQLLKNVITNPGFESGEFATLLFVEGGATETSFRQDNWQVQWNALEFGIGQPEGFLDGAQFEVMLGERQGDNGIVEAFRHENDRYTFDIRSTTAMAQPFGAQDLVVIRQSVPGFESDANPYAIADPTDTRPDSPGAQSLKLSPPPTGGASYRYFMDSYWRDGDTSAGRLYVFEGNWRFEVWARGSSNTDAFSVSFERENERSFVTETFPLTTAWQKFVYEFYVPPSTDIITGGGQNPAVNLLKFEIKLPRNAEAVWIDDISLMRRDYANPTVFTDKVVDALLELQPGILRNWGNQLGSTFANQIAEPFARKTTAFQPNTARPQQFDFSLHEFLELADLVGAEPWYVVPPTWTEDELSSLMAYLAAPAGDSEWAAQRAAMGQEAPWTDVFPVIHLEYGNELWGGNAGNDPFIGATLRGGDRVGEIGGERIGIMKQSAFYNSAEFNFILGGQFEFPERQGQIEARSNQHDTIAISPYFGTLEETDSDEDIFYPLFARAVEDLQPGTGKVAKALESMRLQRGGTDLAVYEINFHTTTGDAPLAIRNSFMTGMGGGLALPFYMLNYQKELGLQNQAAFVFSQYSFQMSNREYARIWGLLRDTESTGRKRPTWLGLELANTAIRGDMLRTIHDGAQPSVEQAPINSLQSRVELPLIHSYAYREGTDYALVLFNLSLTDAHTVIVQPPMTPDPDALLHRLAGENIYHDNESSTLVRIETEQLNNFSQSYEIVLPPHSLQVLEWGADGEAPQILVPTATPTAAPLPTSTPDPELPIYIPPTPLPIIDTVEFPTRTATEQAIAAASTPPTPIPGEIGGTGDDGGLVVQPPIGGDEDDSLMTTIRSNPTLFWLLVAIAALNVVGITSAVVYVRRRVNRPISTNKFGDDDQL